jgi:transcriptional regulator with PAS, ATPase and Fis domain
MQGHSEVLPRIIGQSDKTKQVLRNIEKVARGSWPVLILGETGTGKEVVARSIYHACPNGPFVTIDCSSIVGALLETELFGHTRGAFTGAVGAKTGLIEMANGGTAFFDEIGELPLDFQAKLLRVLQEKEFRPVGALASKRSDFRVIAATNRNLAAEVERGNFRRDLYYRLNVVTIRLAPLRERREDIPVLVEHFLERYGRGHRLTPEAMDLLMAYDWPGNVRELENTIQQMVAIHSGPLLHLTDMPTTLRNFQSIRRGTPLAAAVGGAPPPVSTAAPVRAEGSSPIVPLAELERRAILEAIERTNGDRSAAAYLLGIGRTTLYRKLKEYGQAD